MKRILLFFDADRVILGAALIVALLYGGRWANEHIIRPIVYKPPPGMAYLAPPVRLPLGIRFALMCEGCVYKK